MKIKRVLIITLCVFWILLTSLVSGAAYICTSFDIKLNSSSPQQEYNHILKDADLGEVTVNKIAMLGSHDALAYNISDKSKPDTSQNNIANNAIVSTLANGMVARLAKAQNHDIYTQLMCGVRFIDARITYCYNEFYTSHGVISHKLKDSLQQILQFLDENKGEFIIFSINKYYPGQSDFETMCKYIESIKRDGKSLFDYVNYDMDTETTQSGLTYNELTENGTKGGVLFINDTEFSSETFEKYFRLSNLNSKWHNKAQLSEILACINAYYPTITDDSILRVNQTQLTSNGKDWFHTLTGWSLLNWGETNNGVLVDNENFYKWLEKMPIYLCDYTTSTVNNFNSKINQKILEYNKSLTK